jgi:uncharacterized protein YvpB
MLKFVLTISTVGVLLGTGTPISALAATVVQSSKLPSSFIIKNVPEIKQDPQLYNGCEVTSLAMLLNYKGVAVSKMTLASALKKDPTKLVGSVGGQIIRWGDPYKGFVGDIYNDSPAGYGVYHGPIASLASKYAPHKVKDITGSSLRTIESFVAKDDPVEVITTYNFEPDNSTWYTYTDEYGSKVRINMDEHAVLVVGYNKYDVFVNNPLNGVSYQDVPISDFLSAWDEMGKQAITVV